MSGWEPSHAAAAFLTLFHREAQRMARLHVEQPFRADHEAPEVSR